MILRDVCSVFCLEVFLSGLRQVFRAIPFLPPLSKRRSKSQSCTALTFRLAVCSSPVCDHEGEGRSGPNVSPLVYGPTVYIRPGTRSAHSHMCHRPRQLLLQGFVFQGFLGWRNLHRNFRVILVQPLKQDARLAHLLTG